MKCARDWSSFQVNLEPLSRKLYEHLNRHEWEEAADAADELASIATRLYVIAVMKENSNERR